MVRCATATNRREGGQTLPARRPNPAGSSARAVVAEIDRRLAGLDEKLRDHEELVRERERLRAARATLLGEATPGQVSREDVATYLVEHPGSRPSEIAAALGVSANRVSAHLFRGKTTTFVSRGGGWHVRDAGGGRG